MSEGSGRLRWNGLAWPCLWLALLLVVWATRPLLPIDETRYASVAWEMWLRHSYLVPYVNGAPYSDKPPLLFWLIVGGWKIFGVAEWWLRLVSPAFSLGSLFLLVRVARTLWPEPTRLRITAPWLLLGTVVWSLYGTLLAFDMLLSFFTLAAMYFLIHTWRHGGWKGWALVGVAIGLGILSKGPVMLLYVGPVAVLAPWWGRDSRRPWWRWYAGLAAAVVIGAAMGLAWALPAAHAGGPAYASRILWHQTIDRLGGTTVHMQPIWWYLSMLPLVLFPWSMSPIAWRALRRLIGSSADHGVRFCFAWLLPSFVIFSLIKSKQLHYLLPLMPAAALLMARGLTREMTDHRRRDVLPPAIAYTIVAALLVVAPHLQNLRSWLGDDYPSWLANVSSMASLPLLAAGSLLVSVDWKRWQIPVLSSAGPIWLIVVHLAVMRVAAPCYDPSPTALRIRRWQEEGRPIANAATYHSQFAYLGRLEQPIEQISLEDAPAWMSSHPGGRVLVYHKQWPVDSSAPPHFTQCYKGRVLAAWGERAVLEASTWPPPPLERGRRNGTAKDPRKLHTLTPLRPSAEPGPNIIPAGP